MATADVIIEIGHDIADEDDDQVEGESSSIRFSPSSSSQSHDPTEVYWWPIILILTFWFVCEYAYPIMIVAGNIALLYQTHRITDLFNSKGISTIPVALAAITYSLILFTSSLSLAHIALWRPIIVNTYRDQVLWAVQITPLDMLLTIVVIGIGSVVNRVANLIPLKDVAHRFLLHGLSIVFLHTRLSTTKRIYLMDFLISLSNLHRIAVPIPLWYILISTSEFGRHAPIVHSIYFYVKILVLIESAISSIKASLDLWKSAPLWGQYIVAAKDDDDHQCAICFDSLTNAVSLPCSHIFCEDCICEWADRDPSLTTSPSCPMCRAALTRCNGRSYNTNCGPIKYGSVHLI